MERFGGDMVRDWKHTAAVLLTSAMTQQGSAALAAGQEATKQETPKTVRAEIYVGKKFKDKASISSVEKGLDAAGCEAEILENQGSRRRVSVRLDGGKVFSFLDVGSLYLSATKPNRINSVRQRKLLKRRKNQLKP